MHSMKKKKHSKRAKSFQGDRVAVSQGLGGKASPRRECVNRGGRNPDVILTCFQRPASRAVWQGYRRQGREREELRLVR